MTSAHPAFDRVAGLFDDYRAHYGRTPSPDVTRSWLRDQIAARRLSVAEARAAGAQRVSLQTETGNAGALALYAAAGFVPVTGLELLNLALTRPG